MPASIALVALQFAALAVIAWPWRAAQWNPLAWPLLAAATVAATWTLLHNRPGNFSVLPEPRATTRLVTGGPYAWVRHPMYTSLLLGAAGVALGWNTPVHWIALGALAVVLDVKARREERLLTHRFADYADYARRTPRFLPFARARRAR